MWQVRKERGMRPLKYGEIQVVVRRSGGDPPLRYNRPFSGKTALQAVGLLHLGTEQAGRLPNERTPAPPYLLNGQEIHLDSPRILHDGDVFTCSSDI